MSVPELKEVQAVIWWLHNFTLSETENEIRAYFKTIPSEELKKWEEVLSSLNLLTESYDGSESEVSHVTFSLIDYINSGLESLSPEERIMKAFDNLSPEERQRIIKQFQETKLGVKH